MPATKDSYRVKFVDAVTGETRYGTVQRFNDEADAAFAKGLVRIDDAIMPFYHEVPNDDSVVDLGFSKFEIKDGKRVLDEYEKFVDAAWKEADAVSRKLPEGVHVGSLFNIGVADGLAWYIVTKVFKKSCKIEWRGFGGCDAYYDHHFKHGGTFPIEDVLPYVRRQKAGLFRRAD